jgi:hypothetical protein
MVLGTMVMPVLKALFTCSHAKARAVEGKTYCPDCGRGVIFRWVVLRCTECGQRRPSHYRLRQVVPAELCCTYCGEAAVHSQILLEPEFYQLRHALLAFESEPPAESLLYRLTVAIRSWVHTSLSASESACTPLPRLPLHAST